MMGAVFCSLIDFHNFIHSLKYLPFSYMYSFHDNGAAREYKLSLDTSKKQFLFKSLFLFVKPNFHIFECLRLLFDTEFLTGTLPGY